MSYLSHPIRDPFIILAHLTTTECWPVAEGYVYEGVYSAMSRFSIRSQWQDPKILLLFFVIRIYNEKLRHRLKLLVPKFCSDLSARLKHIADKQVPVKLKPIVVDRSR